MFERASKPGGLHGRCMRLLVHVFSFFVCNISLTLIFLPPRQHPRNATARSTNENYLRMKLISCSASDEKTVRPSSSLPVLAFSPKSFLSPLDTQTLFGRMILTVPPDLGAFPGWAQQRLTTYITLIETGPSQWVSDTLFLDFLNGQHVGGVQM